MPTQFAAEKFEAMFELGVGTENTDTQQDLLRSLDLDLQSKAPLDTVLIE